VGSGKYVVKLDIYHYPEQEAHKLAGSLGSFGFPKGSLLANEIEDVFQNQKSISQAKCFYLDKLLMELL